MLRFRLELEDFPAALNIIDELQKEGPHGSLRIYAELLGQLSHRTFYGRTLFIFHVLQKALDSFKVVGQGRYDPVGVHHSSFGKTVDVSNEALALKVDLFQNMADVISRRYCADERKLCFHLKSQPPLVTVLSEHEILALRPTLSAVRV